MAHFQSVVTFDKPVQHLGLPDWHARVSLTECHYINWFQIFMLLFLDQSLT